MIDFQVDGGTREVGFVVHLVEANQFGAQFDGEVSPVVKHIGRIIERDLIEVAPVRCREQFESFKVI